MDIMKIVRNWNLDDVKKKVAIKDNAIKLICGDGQAYFLKERKSVDKLHTEAGMLSHLKREGIPVSVPVRTKDGRLFHQVDTKAYCLYPFIAGDHIDYVSHEETKEAVRIYGSILGRLHSALATYEGKSEGIREMNLQGEVFDFAIPTIGKHLDDPGVSDTLNKLRPRFKKAFDAMDKQYIHRDFHGENILFKNGEWVGLIDFDLCVKGYRVFDIAYVLTSILSSDFSDQSFRESWLDLIPIIIEAYTDKNPLTKAERDTLWHVFLSIELIVSAYFLSVDDEDRAEENLAIFHWLMKRENTIRQLTTQERTT